MSNCTPFINNNENASINETTVILFTDRKAASTPMRALHVGFHSMRHNFYAAFSLATSLPRLPLSLPFLFPSYSHPPPFPFPFLLFRLIAFSLYTIHPPSLSRYIVYARYVCISCANRTLRWAASLTAWTSCRSLNSTLFLNPYPINLSR